MNFLPIFLRLEHQPCLVVGGGEVAARKVHLLQRAGAVVTVVAPKLCPALQRLCAGEDDAPVIHWRQGRFDAADLDAMVLVIAATNDSEVNRQVSELAGQRRIPVNVVDQPALCSFIFPSIIDRSPVVVAISTGGASPVLARLLRARLETLIPAGYGRLASLLDSFRETVKQRFSSSRDRRRFWERILSGPLPEQVFAGREEQASGIIRAALAADKNLFPDYIGEVYLIGAGPGDPDLLTFRALRLMQMADVVLYDRLVAEPILDLVRRDAERIYVGKKRDYHSVRQEEISQLLVKLAQEGKRVVRLKGGDPFIFGRGGEEIELLAQHNIPFQVVPGITAAAGCASYAGIPLTHRDYAQSVVFVTGHLKDGNVNLNWANLAQPQQTLVIYMGLHGADIICRELIAHGLAATTPVALVTQGSTPRQQVFIATLASLPDTLATTEVHAPTLIIVGGVVKLHDKLAWFKKIVLSTEY
jgi:uroporphyrin-III C-methyltransferase/precorrin-2 dehydrogenase/sirohydrochlorin ferrochelatase